MGPGNNGRRVTLTWQQIGEQQLRLHGLELAELDRIEQALRQEQHRLAQELEMQRREMVVLVQQASEMFRKKAEEAQHIEHRQAVLSKSLDVVAAYCQGETGDALLTRLVDTVMEATGAEAVAVFALRRGVLKLIVIKGLPAELFNEMVAVRLGEGVCGLAAKRKEPVIATVLPEELWFLHSKPDRNVSTCFVAIPLLAGEDLVGAVEVAATNPPALTPPELKVLMGLGSFVRTSLTGWNTKKRPEILPAPT